MTARQTILGYPEEVQIVIKMYITKASLEDNKPDFEKYGLEAIKWWEHLVTYVMEGKVTPVNMAKHIISRMREDKASAWYKILRQDAN